MSWVGWQTLTVRGWTLRGLTQTPLTAEEGEFVVGRMEHAISTLPKKKSGMWVSRGCFGEGDTGRLWYIFVGPNSMILSDSERTIDDMWRDTCGKSMGPNPPQGIRRNFRG